MKRVVFGAVVLLSSSILYADISVTDRSSTLRFLADASVLRPGTTVVPAADRAARRTANQAKRDARHSKRNHGTGLSPTSLAFHPRDTVAKAQALIDASGLQYFINTNMFATSTSEASGAASDATFTQQVAASTSGGGAMMMTLNDMFDGYGGICISLTNATGPCSTGNPAFTAYNLNGLAAFDGTVPAGPACTNRQISFPSKTIGPLTVSRKVFVPTNDQFIRWMNSFTNTSGAPVTFTMITSNNLGSDLKTIIVNSSNGDAVAQTTDTWVSTFQNFTGNTSTDPRIGHVLQGTGAPTPVSFINFANGDGFPWWTYSITLAAGQTKVILTFATGQGTKAAAAAKAAALALLPASTTQCMSATELGRVVNFVTSTDLSITKNTSSPIAFGGNPITYTLAVSNLGSSPATIVSVTDTLPAGAGFVSASGTGWTCNLVAGVVTCTLPSLAVGAANPITLTMTVPAVASPGTFSNTATVSSATTDPTPGNNSSTSTIPSQPGSNIPALSAWMLMMLAAVLGLVALARRT